MSCKVALRYILLPALPTHFIYAHPASITTLIWVKFPVADPDGNLLLDQPTPYLLSGGVDPNIVMHDVRDASAQVMIDKYIRCKSIWFCASPLSYVVYLVSHFRVGLAWYARLSDHAR